MNALVLVVSLVVVLLLSLTALAVSLVALRRAARRPARRSSGRVAAAELPADVDALRAEVQALRVEATQTLRHLALVRYDAFGDMGGHLSWSLALLDDGGDGVVLTSIHGRSDARAYAKAVAAWSCEQPLSTEEREAVKLARDGAAELVHR